MEMAVPLEITGNWQDTTMYCKQESLANAKVSARQPCWSKTDFDVKWAFKVILVHSFCNQLQADKGLHIAM